MADGPLLVSVSTPILQIRAHVVNVQDPMLVRAFEANGRVEAVDEGTVRGAALRLKSSVTSSV